MDAAAEMKAKIDEQLADIQKLPAMPGVVQKILVLANDPDADIQKLSEEISKDAAITAGVIRLSNSAYYRPQRPVRSVQEAVMTLGLRTVKNIVLITASKGILAIPLEGYKMDAKDVWDHSLIVAELADRICKMRRTRVPPDVAFTAGILHDIGKIVLAQYFKKAYRQVAAEIDKNPEVSFSQIERSILGYDHAEIGGKLLSIWQFPPELSEAVALQYHPEKAQKNPELTCLVHLANHIALVAGVGVDTGGLSESLSKFALDTLKITDNDLQALYSSLPEFLGELTDLRGT
ncbi:MAG: HDOD domain-containing protein [Leptospirales bacterium]|nr:HDOD domain-containing protein [Leptospirales bacterium]